MPKEIFDQERPRSAMARRLDEAFAGCEQWTLAPPAPPRRQASFEPRLSPSVRMVRAASAARGQEASGLY